jgi:ABC-type proline/glycine betaine transport system ATPase subunit
LKILWQQLRFAALFVTHDQREALHLSIIGGMNHGAIQQCGAPRAVLETPANDFIRDFLSGANDL